MEYDINHLNKIPEAHRKVEPPSDVKQPDEEKENMNKFMAEMINRGYRHTPETTREPAYVLSFDDATQKITQARGEDYGHPKGDFARIAKLKEALSDCPHPEIRHALEMIAVKMSRLCNSPKHLDSIVDIAGYARTIAMIIDEEEKNHEKRG